jgi:predicted nuclease with TOPRIM domain
MDACNRVIEAQHSGNPGDAVRGGWLQEMEELKSKLSREQAENVRLSAQVKAREDQQAALESRIGQLEAGMRDQQGGANAELVARLQRAESQLASNRGRK